MAPPRRVSKKKLTASPGTAAPPRDVVVPISDAAAAAARVVAEEAAERRNDHTASGGSTGPELPTSEHGTTRPTVSDPGASDQADVGTGAMTNVTADDGPVRAVPGAIAVADSPVMTEKSADPAVIRAGSGQNNETSPQGNQVAASESPDLPVLSAVGTTDSDLQPGAPTESLRMGSPLAVATPNESYSTPITYPASESPSWTAGADANRLPEPGTVAGPEPRGRGGAATTGAPEHVPDGRADLDTSNASSQYTVPVSVYLLPEARSKAARMRKIHHKLNSEIAMDAIDAMYQRKWLERLVQRRHVQPRDESSLFQSRRASRSTRTASYQSTRILWQVKLFPEDIDVVKHLQEQFGAGSLSEMISVAVEGFFIPPSEDEVRTWKELDYRVHGIQDLDTIGVR